MEYRAKITPEEIEKMPVAAFGGEIVVTGQDGTLIADAVEYLGKQKVLGFDTETRPNFQAGKTPHGVALLQLSGPDRAYLFRLCRIGLPQEVAAILADDGILKVGAAVRDDIAALRKLRRFQPAGFADLQSIVGDYGIEDRSVKKMAAIILGVKVSKSQQLSNWEADELTAAQQMYAATDAWICRSMYYSLTDRSDI